MKYFDKTVSHVLNLAEIDEKKLSDIEEDTWRKIISYATQLDIHLYLFKWLQKNDICASFHSAGQDFSRLLLANKTRNMLLRKQILLLSSLLTQSGIPHMFLKGAAGMVRGWYDLECRRLSDIDLMIPDEWIPQGVNVLETSGYRRDTVQYIPPHHHHISPYYHPKHPGGVEIHREPYMYSMLDRPAIPDVWENADTVAIDGVRINVPSLTDHAWISMRTTLYPTLKQFFEISGLLRPGYAIDGETLRERAEREHIPHLIDSFAYMCNLLFDIPPFTEYEERKLMHWDRMNQRFQKKTLRTGYSRSFYKRSLAALFFTPENIMKKIRFTFWMSRYEALVYQPKSRISLFLHTAWRFMKDIFLTLLILPQYYYHSPRQQQARKRVTERL
jgi:hypothetical protein